MPAMDKKWRKFIFFEKVNKFNNSKPGIIIGFVLVALYLAMGIIFTIVNVKKGNTDRLTMFCSVLTLTLGVIFMVTEILRAKKYIKRNRTRSAA